MTDACFSNCVTFCEHSRLVFTLQKHSWIHRAWTGNLVHIHRTTDLNKKKKFSWVGLGTGDSKWSVGVNMSDRVCRLCDGHQGVITSLTNLLTWTSCWQLVEYIQYLIFGGNLILFYSIFLLKFWMYRYLWKCLPLMFVAAVSNLMFTGSVKVHIIFVLPHGLEAGLCHYHR